MKENGYVGRGVVQSCGKEAEEAEEEEEEVEEGEEEDGQTKGGGREAEGRAGRIVSAGWLPAGARIEGTSRGEKKEIVGGMADVRG